MTNVPEYWSVDDFRDPGAINYINSEQQTAEAKYGAEYGAKYVYEKGREARHKAICGVLKFGRDNGRTPMQWHGGHHAGFSDAHGETWIEVNHNHGLPDSINVEDQRKDDHSIWHFWKEHIAMRKGYRDIFMHGKFEILDEDNEDIFAYTKTAADGRRAVVVLNFSGEEKSFPWFESVGQQVCYLTGNICQPVDVENEPFQPWEGRVLVWGSP